VDYSDFFVGCLLGDLGNLGVRELGTGELGKGVWRAMLSYIGRPWGAVYSGR